MIRITNTDFYPTGAPKILLDGLQQEVIATIGEPYRIRIPFKGSPIPTATFYNVSSIPS
jgi:hypothetical protein